MYVDDRNINDVFVGKSVVRTDFRNGILELSDGTQVKIALENSDCCSYIELVKLSTTDHIITHAEFGDDSTGEGNYNAWIHVITEAGELNVAEADGDASNGYYLDGFALGVQVIKGGS